MDAQDNLINLLLFGKKAVILHRPHLMDPKLKTASITFQKADGWFSRYAFLIGRNCAIEIVRFNPESITEIDKAERISSNSK